MKGYQILYQETSPPIPKPNLDRSPSFARRSLSSSPTQQKQNIIQTQISQSNNRQTITEISLINPRSRSENQNNDSSNSNKINRQVTKSSDFRMKKIPETSTSNNNSSLKDINNNNTSVNNNNNKQLDKISEETKKDNENDSVSMSSAKYKMRYSSARTRTSQQSVVELKPATVEVFFRNTNKTDPTAISSKLTADKLDRKPIATTVFPPPKIGLKS
jgi:hypothetical protein